MADSIGSLTQGKDLGAESTNDASTTIYSVADLVGFVKKFANEYTPAPEMHRFLVNNDGTPKEMYHGTSTAGFTVFDISVQRKSQANL